METNIRPTPILTVRIFGQRKTTEPILTNRNVTRWLRWELNTSAVRLTDENKDST